ncbi:MAG: zinc ribbon domain-containing protein [Gammaproteobacteria bacterium]|nr:zinc ribbon domain-containing protein [Gammaproteobacteria bacterium]
MPTYDYHCDANGKTMEVIHRMSDQVNTWGELCEKAGIDPGETSLDSPVHRLATGGNVISSNSMGSGVAPAPACNTGSCCAGGMCGLD